MIFRYTAFDPARHHVVQHSGSIQTRTARHDGQMIGGRSSVCAMVMMLIRASNVPERTIPGSRTRGR
jgi:hypothetical protein